MKYRAEVFVRGATTEKVYRSSLLSVERNAIKKLTRSKPGTFGLYPDKVVISESVVGPDGRTSAWTPVKTVSYAELTDDQHEWRKKEAQRKQNS